MYCFCFAVFHYVTGSMCMFLQTEAGSRAQHSTSHPDSSAARLAQSNETAFFFSQLKIISKKSSKISAPCERIHVFVKYMYSNVLYCGLYNMSSLTLSLVTIIFVFYLQCYCITTNCTTLVKLHYFCSQPFILELKKF